jgi:hypothetical protein
MMMKSRTTDVIDPSLIADARASQAERDLMQQIVDRQNALYAADLEHNRRLDELELAVFGTSAPRRRIGDDRSTSHHA